MNQTKKQSSLYTLKDYVDFQLCKARVLGLNQPSDSTCKSQDRERISDQQLRLAIYEEVFAGPGSLDRLSRLKLAFGAEFPL